MRSLPLLLCAVLLAAAPAVAQRVELLTDDASPRAQFAAQRITAALQARGHQVIAADLSQAVRRSDIPRIILFSASDTLLSATMKAATGNFAEQLEPEGFALRPSDGGTGTTWVMGFDAAGVLYGGLELAEQISLYGLEGVRATVQNPHMSIRGTKFNIPLDARTPSYTDMSDVAQQNIAEMWSLDFWKSYLDNLALHRYNLVSLWNLHPFPSMVRVPEYPDIALDDVKRSTARFNENYSTRVVDIAGPEILGSLETLREISMDEKIEFWRTVMQYAADRNIDFYIMTWNIYTYGTSGQYGITDDFRNETTVDYFRKSVRAMFDTYPLLAGIGLTTGENFGQNAGSASFREKEDWAFRTYGQGLLDAAAAHPERKFSLVHRLHETGVQSDAASYAADANVAAVDIADWFAPLIQDDDIEFLFSFKYAQAHVYSSTRQRFHEAYVKDIQGMKTLWTLRNDDVYYFRWGAPDFVREFFVNMPGDEVSRGFYYGSDQYVWGREFLSLNPESPRELELEKHWYQWMLWGRLGYDPGMSNQRFIDLLQARFPQVVGADLFRAWQDASMIYPITTGFHWGLYDFHWYIEGSRGRSGVAGSVTGYHDIDRFISLAPHSGTGYLSIPDFVSHVQRGTPPDSTTPIEVAAMLHRHADSALSVVSRLHGGGGRELRATLADIEAIAYLGKYYGHKIRGATELALFRATGDEGHRAEAVGQLRDAARYWRRYASTALGQYTNPLWTNRVGYVDWRRTMSEVLNDITIAGGEATISSTPSVTTGTTLEAEGAATGGGIIGSEVGGFTGEGYIQLEGEGEEDWLEWTYEASAAGPHLLELRYAIGEGSFPSTLTINGSHRQPITLWTTGGISTWALDRAIVDLNAGTTTIRLTVTGEPRIDHLRVEAIR